MKHSLYYKFILGYLVFGLLGFASIATLSAQLMNKNQVKNQAEAMYDEANLIASAYSSVYQGKKQDLDSVYPQLQAVAKFVRAEIWVVNRQGIIVVDSEQNKRAGTAIEGFDPTATGNKSYCTGTYYGLFPYDVLSVSAPITGLRLCTGASSYERDLGDEQFKSECGLHNGSDPAYPVPDHFAGVHEDCVFSAAEDHGGCQ